MNLRLKLALYLIGDLPLIANTILDLKGTLDTRGILLYNSEIRVKNGKKVSFVLGKKEILAQAIMSKQPVCGKKIGSFTPYLGFHGVDSIDVFCHKLPRHRGKCYGVVSGLVKFSPIVRDSPPRAHWKTYTFTQMLLHLLGLEE